jgi:metallophosphoesterase (TIGR00282 family)
MRIIMIGDVVGDPGLQVLEARLPALAGRYGADFTVVNGENAAGGFGLTVEALDRILAAGADVVTGGNHIWEKREFWETLETAGSPGGRPVLRPANYPRGDVPAAGVWREQIPAVPGRGWILLEKQGNALLVINLQGREMMPAIDCPFRCFDRILAEFEGEGGPPPCICVDFHAESTEEKESLAYYLDGRASVIAGTHTHVQTADERILPGGAAYITDLGMTGTRGGVIGMDTGVCLDRARTQIQFRMECARLEAGDPSTVQGIAVELDRRGRALGIERIRLETED